MKIILALLLYALSCLASAATLDARDRIGAWISPEPQGFFASLARLFSTPPRDRLEIRKDGTVTLVRELGGGKRQTLVATPADVSLHDDLMIATFPLGAGHARLVVTGWSTSHSKRLMGHLYLYDANGLFNGIPVAFDPLRHP